MNELKGKKILITGATGFIGNRMVEVLFHAGADVRAYVRKFKNASRIARFSIPMISGDITDRAALNRAMEGCDLVFHLAHGAAGTDEERRQATVEGTRAVCEVALAQRVSRLVYTSTISVYGPTADGPLDETAPRRAQDFYGAAKLEAENIVQEFCRKQNLPAVILQPTVVYGPFSFWSSYPIEQLHSGPVVLPENGTGLCNPVYVDDVVQGLYRAAVTPGVLGQTYLISGAKPCTWLEYYSAYRKYVSAGTFEFMAKEQLARQLAPKSAMALLRQSLASQDVRDQLKTIAILDGSYKLVKACLPKSALRSIKARVFRIKPRVRSNKPSPPVVSVKKSLPHISHVDLMSAKTSVSIAKAARELGYAPKFTLEQGLGRTVQWAAWSGLPGILPPAG